MEYHPGSCITAGDVEIPVISLGTWKTTDEQIKNALTTSLNLGYRRIRTRFGECKAIGPILKEMFENGTIRRQDIFLSAKLPPVGNRYKDVEHFLRISLDALQVDYLDLYEIGSPMGFINNGESFVPVDQNGDILLDLKTDIVDTWKGMEEQVIGGRVRSIGLSCFNQSQIKRILDHCTIKPANLTTEIHVYCQQKELVSFCKSNGIAVTAEFPLGSPGLQQVLGGFVGEKKFIPSPLKDPVIKDIAKKHNKRPMQILIRYLIEYGVGVLIKSICPKRLKECVDIFDFELTREDFDRISELDRGEDGRTIGGSACTGVLNQLERHPEFPWRT